MDLPLGGRIALYFITHANYLSIKEEIKMISENSTSRWVSITPCASKIGRECEICGAFIDDINRHICYSCSRNLLEMMRKKEVSKIIKNMIKCNKCGDVIESVSVHDFKWCKCKTVAVDGGHEYLRRLGNMGEWEEMSIIRDENGEIHPVKPN